MSYKEGLLKKVIENFNCLDLETQKKLVMFSESLVKVSKAKKI